MRERTADVRAHSSLIVLSVSLALFGTASFAMPDIDFQVPESCASRKQPSEDVVVDIDLSSGKECIPASLAFDAERYKKKLVSVTEGENVRFISRNCMLTAGEYFAAKCNMEGKAPTFDLTSQGTISSGIVTLDKFTVDHCRNLYLPRHLTIKHDVSLIPVLKLEGSLKIDGTYLLVGKAKTCSIIAKQVQVATCGFLGSPQGQEPIEVRMEAPEGVDLAHLPAEKLAENAVHSDASPKSEKIIYSRDAKGGREDLGIVDGDYKVQTVQRVMFKTTPQLIPVDGENLAPVEGGVEEQSRESCSKQN